MTQVRLPASSSPRCAGGIVERAATVDGVAVPVDEVDAREARLRDGPLAAALPAAGTSEGRQLRRWLTQLIVTERVIGALKPRLEKSAHQVRPGPIPVRRAPTE